MSVGALGTCRRCGQAIKHVGTVTRDETAAALQAVGARIAEGGHGPSVVDSWCHEEIGAWLFCSDHAEPLEAR